MGTLNPLHAYMPIKDMIDAGIVGSPQWDRISKLSIQSGDGNTTQKIVLIRGTHSIYSICVIEHVD